MKQHDWNGFTVSINLDEDGDWKAYFVELPHVFAFGGEPDTAREEPKIAWAGVKERILISVS